MSGRILIVDSVATNRIVLKVKMAAAQYDVDTCTNCREAGARIDGHPPDLILINLTDPVEDRHVFCRELRNNPTTAQISIIGIGVADTARARFAALDAGLDDVMTHPISDVLMHARIRSLLRRRHAAAEWQLRDDTRKALGFEEEDAPRLTPMRVTILSDDTLFGKRSAERLHAACKIRAPLLATKAALVHAKRAGVPEAFIIDGTLRNTSQSGLFQLISDLNSHTETQYVTKIVMLQDDKAEVGAMLLDLGVDEIVFEDCEAAELAARLTNAIAIKTQSNRLRDSVRSGLQAAVTDPLTGLHNRRFADAQLSKMMQSPAIDGDRLAVMVIDIDHFKAINDEHGHATGDMVLSDMAERMRRSFRDVDLVARVGGEEFLIAMSNTTVDQAQAAAERLRRNIHSQPFGGSQDEAALSVTVSVGLAFASEGATPSEVIALADAALYDAKSAGRNMVAVAKAA